MNDYRGLISYTLSNLNNRNKGDSRFEEIAFYCMKKEYPQYNIITSSGTASGGDGGLDAYFYTTHNERTKIAFSINKNVKEKIKKELNTIPIDVNSMIFCTNQPLSNREKEKLIEYAKVNKGIHLSLYDLENIIDLSLDIPLVQELLEVPELKIKITKDIVRKYNQLKEEEISINSFLDRTIQRHNSGSKENIFDYISSCNSQIIILQGGAGTGKSSILKKLYFRMLYDDDNFALPPFFMHLSKYTSGKIKNLIHEIVEQNVDLKCLHYYLLLDGLDEISDASLNTLLTELDLILNVSKCYRRKVVITSRTGWYGINKVCSFFCDCSSDTSAQLEIIDLSDLTDVDIMQLMPSELSESERQLIKDRVMEIGYTDNIFFLSHAIKYLSQDIKRDIRLIELLNRISNDEVSQLLRANKDLLFQIDSIAAFMQLSNWSKVLVTYNKSIEKEIQISFSHRIVQEFLCAKFLSVQTITQIINLTCMYGHVIPAANNVLALLLNYLLEEGESEKYYEIEKYLLEIDSNVSVLLKTDRHYIPKRQILHFFNIAIGLYPFISIGFSMSEVANILNYIWDDYYPQLVKMLNSGELRFKAEFLISCYLRSIKDNHSYELAGELVKFISDESKKKNYHALHDLYHLFRYMPIIDNIKFVRLLADYLLNENYNSGFFCEICYFFYRNRIILSKYKCKKLIIKYFALHKDIFFFTGLDQDDDNNKNILDYTNGFIILLEYLIESDQASIYDLIDILLDGNIKHTELRLSGIISNKLTHEIKNNKSCLSKHKNAVSTFFLELNKNNIPLDGYKQIFDALDIDKDRIYFLNLIGLENIKNIVNPDSLRFSILNNNGFSDKYIKLFKHAGDEYSFNSLFGYLNLLLDDVNVLESIVVLPVSWRSDIEKVKRRLELENRNQEKKKREVYDYRIIENIEEFLRQAILLIDYFMQENITENQYLEIQQYNHFVIYVLAHFDIRHKDIISKLKLFLTDLGEVDDRYYCIVRYIIFKGYSLDVLSKNECDLVISWLINFLMKEKNNQNKTDEHCYVWAAVLHILGCVSLRERIKSELNESLLGSLYYLIRNPQYWHLDNKVANEYNDISIDYLTWYLNEKDIADFLFDKYDDFIKDELHALAFFGFLIRHRDTCKFIKIYEWKIRDIIINLVNIKADGPIAKAALEYVFLLKIHLDAFNINIIKDRLQEEISVLIKDKQNDVTCIISNLIKSVEYLSDNDKKIISGCFRQLYEVEHSTTLKKIYAENILLYDHFAVDILEWYSEYLINDPNSDTPLDFEHDSHKYAIKSLEALPCLIKLFDYAFASKPDDRKKQRILLFIDSCYKSLANSISSINELEKLLAPIDYFMSKADGYMGEKEYIIKIFISKNNSEYKKFIKFEDIELSPLSN